MAGAQKCVRDKMWTTNTTRQHLCCATKSGFLKRTDRSKWGSDRSKCDVDRSKVVSGCAVGLCIVGPIGLREFLMGHEVKECNPIGLRALVSPESFGDFSTSFG